MFWPGSFLAMIPCEEKKGAELTGSGREMIHYLPNRDIKPKNNHTLY
jgi:hypothetical protein